LLVINKGARTLEIPRAKRNPIPLSRSTHHPRPMPILEKKRGKGKKESVKHTGGAN